MIGHTRENPTEVVIRSTTQGEALRSDVWVVNESEGMYASSCWISASGVTRGFSGGPVLNDAGLVVGIAMIKREDEGKVLALSPLVLRQVWTDMPSTLLPPAPTPIPLTSRQNGAAQLLPGIVVTGDIVGFSSLPARDQYKAWDKLVTVLDHELSRTSLIHARNFNVDGFVIVFPTAGRSSDDDHHGAVVDLIAQCMREAAANRDQEPAVSIRIALHEGNYQEIPSRATSPHLLGKAVTECLRVLSFNETGGTMVASDEFVKGWASRNGLEIYRRFAPGDPDLPVEIFLRRDDHHRIGIRAYIGDNGDRPPPLRLWLPSALDQLLDERVGAIAEEFSELVRSLPRPTRKRGTRSLTKSLSVRASLFVPQYMYNVHSLCPTQHRYIAGEGKGGGKTQYTLDGEGAGPAGRAFKTGKVQVLHNLPSFAEQPDAYIARLKEWGVDEVTVRGFNRHARTFIDIPFSLASTDPRHFQEPLGVLCIDVLEPLEHISADDLRRIAEFFRSDYGVALASLRLLRIL